MEFIIFVACVVLLLICSENRERGASKSSRDAALERSEMLHEQMHERMCVDPEFAFWVDERRDKMYAAEKQAKKDNPRPASFASRGDFELWESRIDAPRRQFEWEVRRYLEDHPLAPGQFGQEPRMRQAKPEDYARWLRGYHTAGGKITHKYDYTMPEDFRVALRDFNLAPLYGARSVNVIVPAGLSVEVGGHCTAYHMSDFSVHGSKRVPMYNDVSKILGTEARS